MGIHQQNLYEVLGLSRDASQDLIKARCVELGEWYRPDKNSGDLDKALKFAQIEKAYETLVDPAERAAYDAELLGQPSKPIAIKRAGRSGAIVLSGLAILLTLGYALGYRPYIAQREEAARIAQREEAARIAVEETRKVADEKARVSEAQVRAAEARARIVEAQATAAEDRARQAEAKMRSDQFETSKQLALARLADAEDLARVENLRTNCDAAAGVSNRSRTAAGSFGSFVGSQLALAYCNQYQGALKNRQRYEAIRSVDPIAAAKELEAQRERRLRNSPIITNCTTWAPGNATCISR